MRRDLEPIDLPPPAPDYGGGVAEGDPRDMSDQLGNQPIDNLDLGTDPEHLGGPEGGKVDDEPGRPAVEDRGPVQEAPGADDPDLAKRQKLAKSTDPTGDNPAETIDPTAEQPRGW
jgi:hypothetical protein